MTLCQHFNVVKKGWTLFWFQDRLSYASLDAGEVYIFLGRFDGHLAHVLTRHGIGWILRDMVNL